MKKEVIKRVGAAVIASTLTLSLLGTPVYASEAALEQTGSTVTNSETVVTFKNKELENIIRGVIGNSINLTTLGTISELEIPAMSNHDLSDLAYLTNLKKVTIQGINVDCSQLTNTKLEKLIIIEGNMYNTNSLPTSLSILNIFHATILDGTLYTPSQLATLYITNCNINKINISKPESLFYFYYSSYGFLDLNDIKNCKNLAKITIRRSPNVTHGEVLTSFNKTRIYLDESTILWLSSNTLRNIPITENKENLVNTASEIENIVSSLNLDSLSDEDKLDDIILYVINQIEYDSSAAEDIALANYYNDYPLSSAIHSDLGTCVSYATLFKAIANRVGLDNYQVSSYVHTWNMVKLSGESEYKSYDLTGLDKPFTALRSTNNTTGLYDRTYNRETTPEYYISQNQTDNLFYYGFAYEKTTDRFYLNAQLPAGTTLAYSDVEEPPVLTKEVNKTLQKRYKK